MKHPADLFAVSGLRVRQIGKSDIPAIGDLLARGFQTKSREFWSALFVRLDEHPTPPGYPKYGYLLESGGTAVGAILQIFTAMPSGNESRIRCNVSSWFVQDRFRSYASLLVSKALSHRNVTYLNVTPAPHTISIIEAQGYSKYSGGLFVAMPVLQLSFCGARVTVIKSDDPRPKCAGFEHQLLLDHAKYGCLSLWCTTTEESYPFVFRPRISKGIPIAQLVYCRSLDHFVRVSGAIGRFLMTRGRLLVAIDSNQPIAGLVGKFLDARAARYFKGPDRPRLGDLAYTEIAMFGM
jgi:hypothetical protein